MPKKSKIAKSKKQQRLSNNPVVVERRKTLKSQLKTEDGIQAMFALQKRKDLSRTRAVKRCRNCNRARGVYRYFSLCRLCLIKNAGLGIIPGLRLSSW